MSIEVIKVPDIGSEDPVDVIEVSVKPGDVLQAEDTVLVLESDKATVEVPLPKAGTVRALLVKVGDRVREGDPMLELDVAADGEMPVAEAPTVEPSATSAAAPVQTAGTAAPVEAGSAAPTPAAATGRQADAQLISVPDLGDIQDAELIELHIRVGDTVEAEQTVAVLESDKASVEIPSPRAGVVRGLRARVGDKLNTGMPLFELSAPSSVPPVVEVPVDPTPVRPMEDVDPVVPPTHRSPAPPPVTQVESVPSRPVHAGPAVRKLARELGVDLATVPGTGSRGRITQDDVHQQVRRLLAEKPAAAPAAAGGLSLDLPDIDFSKFGPVTREELNKVRRVSATHLHRAWLTIPHVTQFDEADITDLEAFRVAENQRLARSGRKLTMLAFLVKACAAALKEFPRFNSSLDKSGEALVLKQYIHIGVAVDTPNGLVVPVVRDADRKGVLEIAAEIGDLAARARDRKLAPSDMQGGTFSISSLGGIGGTAFTPIVNWPEVAILGVSRTQTRPVWNGQEFVPRDMLPLSLSYDHRVIDGADAARFTTHLSGVLTDLRRVLL